MGKITLLLLLLDFELLNPQGPSPPQLLTCFLVIKRFKCHFIMYIPGSWGSLRVTLDEGPGTKSPRTNLNQIELWIGPFFTLKENTFFYGTMRMSKVPGSNIKKCVIEVWEVWEDYVHLWPPVFFCLLFFMVLKNSLFIYFLLLLHTINLLSSFFIFSFSSFSTIAFFLGSFLFEMGISLGNSCKSKSPCTCENWHFNPSLSVPLNSTQKFKMYSF